jgi:tRNA U34 2-thiouridine synthase MnmA/TrmU
MSNGKVKAIALYSGGLDSTLAILQMMKYGVEVEAVTFMTHFGCDASDRSSCGHDPYPAAEKFGFKVKLAHLGQRYIDMVKNPKYGHGKNMNPCIDCRLVMIDEAKSYMEMARGQFIITGEVLGQRPMSQRRFTLDLVARKCGLDGQLVRPLSGRLLPPTVPEKEGLIKREWLLDIEGRSRKRQMALAEEFGLTDYPNPAAGCLLTDERYSDRLRDLLKYNPDPDFNDLNLLRVGRHFRLSDHAKLVVGRDEKENDLIESLRRPDDYIMEVLEFGSPIGLLRGEADQIVLMAAASVVARYSDGKNEPLLRVTYVSQDGDGTLETAPAGETELAKIRI